MRHLLIGLIVAAGFGAGVTAAPWFAPLREVRSQAYQSQAGTTPRYQWRFVADERNRTCILILSDTVAGGFAITSVPAESCQ
jgi:hypothetical protein